MSTTVKILSGLGLLVLATSVAYSQKNDLPPSGPTTLVITFKDGHQQTFSMSEVAKVQYVGAAEANLPLQHFLGRWQVGDGNSGTFVITLESNGEANKTLGASHGIWTIEGNEARINWDDGWHDAIRKVGKAHEKFAFEPGKTFSDQPSNVANAEKLDRKPI